MKAEHIFYDNLIEAIDKYPATDTALSLSVCASPKLVSRLRKKNWPSAINLIRLCEKLGLGLSIEGAQEAPSTIPLVGAIAAGGGDGCGDNRVIAYAEHNVDKVSAPVGLSDNDMRKHGGMSALRVTGASMQPVYDDGDLVYVYAKDPLSSRAENLIGKDCAVVIKGGVDDGAIYLKRLRRSDSGKQRQFNLESLNSTFATMIDVELHNIMPVRHVRKALG